MFSLLIHRIVKHKQSQILITILQKDVNRLNWHFCLVLDFTLRISEAGEEYNEKIEVDPNKRTELFQVPAHPGVDRSDTFHDFKQVRYLTLLFVFSLNTAYIQPMFSVTKNRQSCNNKQEVVRKLIATEDGLGSRSSQVIKFYFTEQQ